MSRFSAEVLVTTCLLSGLAFIPLWQSMGQGEDLIQDYLSARALLAGEDPYQDLVSLREANGFPPSHGQSVSYNPHPPIAIFLTLPVAAMPFVIAWRVIQGVQILSMAIAWNWMGRLFACSGWRYAAAGGAFAIWAPFWQGLDWGQPVGLLVLLTTVLWQCLRQQNATGSGIVLGVACLVRPFLFASATSASTWPTRRILIFAISSIVVAGFSFAVCRCWPWVWLQKASLAEKFTSQCGSIPGVLGLSGTAGAYFSSLVWPF